MVQYNEKQSQVLHGNSFEVNMRLLKSSAKYRSIINKILKVMRTFFYEKFDDYDDAKGISGPNIGIPLRIVGARIRKPCGDFVEGLPGILKENKATDPILFMINPKISEPVGKFYQAKTNCGSVLLKDPIEISRPNSITVSYNTIDGAWVLCIFERPIASTIQHEIDHINGITILDRKRKEI